MKHRKNQKRRRGKTEPGSSRKPNPSFRRSNLVKWLVFATKIMFVVFAVVAIGYFLISVTAVKKVGNKLQKKSPAKKGTGNRRTYNNRRKTRGNKNINKKRTEKKIMQEICDPKKTPTNTNIPQGVVKMRVVAAGIPVSGQQVGSKNCAKLNEILATQGKTAAFSPRFAHERSECEKENQKINEFQNRFRARVNEEIDRNRREAQRLQNKLGNRLIKMAEKTGYTTNNPQVRKAIDILTSYKFMYEDARLAHKSWLGNCGEHSYINTIKTLVAQANEKLPNRTLVKFALKGAGTTHEFVLPLKSNANMQQIGHKGTIRTHRNIQNFILTHGDATCDSWNFFGPGGGYRKIPGEIANSRLLGFGSNPIQWPEASYEVFKPFSEITFSDLPTRLKSSFTGIYNSLVSKLKNLSEQIETTIREKKSPETASLAKEISDHYELGLK